MGHGSRDRVTIDLRGLRERLRPLAAARRMTTAALVRKALVQLLDEASSDGDACRNDIATTRDSQVVKVTLRLSVAHAVVLASRARVADVSQGTYVARLIDGTPAQQRAPDHKQAVAALMASTDRLAVLSSDLNAFMRLLGRIPSSELEPFCASIRSAADDVRDHLAAAAVLVAALRAARGRR